MSNMSYCRFENTFNDLQDCYENMEEPCSENEENYKKRLIELCKLITSEFVGDEIDW